MSKIETLRQKYKMNEHLLSFKNENYEIHIYANGIIGKDENNTIVKDGRKGKLFAKYSAETFFSNLDHYEVIEANFSSNNINISDEFMDDYIEMYL